MHVSEARIVAYQLTVCFTVGTITCSWSIALPTFQPILLAWSHTLLHDFVSCDFIWPNIGANYLSRHQG